MRHDVVLAGGGLANALVALRLAKTRPELDLVLLEQDALLGGSHTWSFHEADVTPAQAEWLAPLVVGSWPAYDVRFPAFARRLASGYCSITSERLHRVVQAALGSRLRLGCAVASVAPDAATLADGSLLRAACVIDGRGAEAHAAFRLGYQKFLGRELRLTRPHGQDAPMLMDATVEQRGGFRFLYTLPLAEDVLLVEDTCYGEEPEIDRAAARAAIADHAAARGLRVAEVRREEQGSLPIPLAGDIDAFWSTKTPGVPCAGLRAALFHPTTGYSLPEAVRLADALAALHPLDSPAALALVREQSRQLWKRGGFFRLLNRMLFQAAAPAERYRVLERFYRLPEGLIRRFYAGRPTLLDRVRLLSGRPPVPVRLAARCLFEPAVAR